MTMLAPVSYTHLGSLNPDSTYDDWKWILIRNDSGNWEHVDHGY